MSNYWKNKKILITGSGGFVGSNAVEFFLKKDAIISATVSPNTSIKTLEKKLGSNINKINLIKIDLLDANRVHHITKGNDIIMNFAAIDGGMKFKIEHSQEIYTKNLSITKILLDAAIKAHVKSFLLLSSTEIYPSDATDLITEDKAISSNWIPEKDGYKLAKWESEQYALDIAKRSNVNIAIVRPANLYGPRDNFENESKIRFIPSVIRNIHLEKVPIKIWGDGSQVKSFLYIEDFLDICATLLEKGVFNIPINVASKNPITLKNLADQIVNLSKSNTSVITDKKQRVVSKNIMIDISLLEKKIGPIKETNLETGLKNTIRYVKALLANKY